MSAMRCHRRGGGALAQLAMTEGSITKLEAARRQLDCALRLRLEGGDSLAVHTLAFAAYCLLRDLIGKSERKKVLKDFEETLEFRKVPNYLKHADSDPGDILKKHDEKHTYITLALAIRLWTERGQPETSPMRVFSALPDPFKPDHRASETLKYVKHGPIADPRAAKTHLDALLTKPSTGDAVITPGRNEAGGQEKR